MREVSRNYGEETAGYARDLEKAIAVRSHDPARHVNALETQHRMPENNSGDAFFTPADVATPT